MPSLADAWQPADIDRVITPSLTLDLLADQGFVSLQLSRKSKVADSVFHAVLGGLSTQVGAVRVGIAGGEKTDSDMADSAAVCVAPRAWLLLCPRGRAGTLVKTLVSQAADSDVYSCVDVSERAGTFSLQGSGAVEALRRSVALDPDSVPAGSAARTLWNGNSVFLWRQHSDQFVLAVDISVSWAFADWIRSLDL